MTEELKTLKDIEEDNDEGGYTGNFKLVISDDLKQGAIKLIKRLRYLIHCFNNPKIEMNNEDKIEFFKMRDKGIIDYVDYDNYYVITDRVLLYFLDIPEEDLE